jgi:hypothetical protein
MQKLDKSERMHYAAIVALFAPILASFGLRILEDPPTNLSMWFLAAPVFLIGIPALAFGLYAAITGRIPLD